MKGSKAGSFVGTNNLGLQEDMFVDFPVGLIILKTSPQKKSKEYKINYINNFAEHLLRLSANPTTKDLNHQLSQFKRWEINNTNGPSLLSEIFDKNYQYNTGTFISSLSMIYVKIKTFKTKIFVCIDNLSEERKSIQGTLVKSLRYQFLLTLYHELYNPMNALIQISGENNNNCECENSKQIQICLLIKLIKYFIKNLIWYVRMAFDGGSAPPDKSSTLGKNENTFLSLEYIFDKTKQKFETLFRYKNIMHDVDFSFFENKYVEGNDNYYKNFIKTIFLFLYYTIPKNGKYEVKSEKKNNDLITVIFAKGKSQISKQETKMMLYDEIDLKYTKEYKIEKTVQTIDITIELLKRFSELLRVKITITPDEETYLILDLPFVQKFEEVDEMVEEFSPKNKEITLDAINRNFNAFINPSTLSSGLLKKKTVSGSWDKLNIPNFLKNDEDVANYAKVLGAFGNNEDESKSKKIIGTSGDDMQPTDLDESSMSNLKGIMVSATHDSFCHFSKFKPIESDSNNNICHNLSMSNNYGNPLNMSVGYPSIRCESGNVFESNKIITSYRKSDVIPDPRRRETYEGSRLHDQTKTKFGICSCADVLLCDDENFNLNALKFFFKKMQIKTDEASNGKECLDKIIEKRDKNCEICKKRWYKLLLLDIMMPVMDGIQVSKEVQNMISKKELNEDFQILIISAHIDSNLTKTLSGVKCIKEFVNKPVKSEKMKKLIQKYYLKEANDSILPQNTLQNI